MASFLSFPIVFGKFRIRKPQFIAFICLASVFLFVLYIVVPQLIASDNSKFVKKSPRKIVKTPDVVRRGMINISTTETAAGLVAKYDEAAAYKLLNYTKHLKSLQDKLNRLTKLLKDKTMDITNRTYDKFVEFGLISKYFHVSKHISKKLPFHWNISKPLLQKLISDKVYYHELQVAVNKTREIALKYKPIYDLIPGSCTCRYTNCECCARIYIKRLKVDQPICTNFTYIAGNQALKTNIYYQKKLAFNDTVSAKSPPEICLIGTHNLTASCVQFLNVTYNVQATEEHKTKLAGCMEFHFKVESKTIASYPVGCFETPTKSEDGNVNKLGNWVV